MIARAYGRKTPAPLPSHRMLSRDKTATTPVAVDLRKHCGPVKNQQSLGSCTGHTFSSSIEWICRAYLNKQPVLSPLFFYAEELIADGNFPNDDGSDGVTGCNVAVTKGCCEDSLYPDASQQIKQPTPEMLANALEYRMGAYHGLTGSAVAISVLGDPTPWPVEIGFMVCASFEGDQLAETGIYNPGPSESIIGGHEVLAVGYDVAPTPVLRPAECPPAFLIQNSWGEDWALKGYFWMPLSVADAAESDLKIVHSGHPWV